MSNWIDDVTSLIFESSFMTLATADRNGVPWVSPVEFLCDEALSFYWVSPLDARHSENVRENPRAALSLYDCTYVPLDGQPIALYAEGSVEELQLADLDPQVRDRWLSWRDRDRKVPRLQRGDRSDSDSPWRVYRLTPAELYALDPSGHPEHGLPASWRVPVDLRETFAQAYRSRLRT